MIQNALCTVILLLAVSSLAFSREGAARYRGDRVVTSTGELDGATICALRDRAGFMWFGTYYGLVRFDGRETRVFGCDGRTVPAGDVDCTIRSIAEDSTGAIWAGTQHGGVLRFNRRTGVIDRYRYDPRDAGSLGEGMVNSIVVDRDGVVWIGADNRSRPDGSTVNRFDARTRSFRRYSLLRGDGVSSSNAVALYLDGRNRLWVASTVRRETYMECDTCLTLSRFDGARDFFRPVAHLSSLSMLRIIGETPTADPVLVLYSHDAVGSLFEAHSSTSNGELRVRPIATSVSSARDRTLGFLSIDRTGALWYAVARHPSSAHSLADLVTLVVGTSSAFADARGHANRADSIVTDILHGVYHDRTGTTWVLTDNGVYRVVRDDGRLRTWRHDPLDATSLGGGRVRAVHVDRHGVLWVGTDRGINRLDPGRNTWWRYERDSSRGSGLPSDVVNAFYETPTGELLVATRLGLASFDRARNRFVASTPFALPTGHEGPSQVWSMLIDRAGRAWLGTYYHLHLKPPDRLAFTRFEHDPRVPGSITGGGVWTLFQDRRGTIWVGTNEGLSRWDEATGSFHTYRHIDGDRRSLAGNRVWAILEDRAGELWVASYGGGLSRFNRATDDFATVTTDDGLPNNLVRGLVEDVFGRFWIPTPKGVVRWDRRTNAFRTYGSADGLLGEDFGFHASARSAYGTLYFGGTGGLSAIDPRSSGRRSDPPRLIVSGVRVFDSLIHHERRSGDSIVLDHDQNFLSIEFALLEYSGKGRPAFRYFLEGVDRRWAIAADGDNAARYTDLSPGIYSFTIHVSGDDDWTGQRVDLVVIIEPPWWQTWSFRGGLALAALGMVVSLMRSRINSARRLEHVRTQSALQATLESQEFERHRIARDLHDGIGQMLAAASINVSRARELLHRAPAGVHGDTLIATLERSESILEKASSGVRTISHALGTNTLRELGLTEALEEMIDTLDPERRTRFDLETVGLDAELAEPINTGLFRIAQELVTNIIRHAHAREATVQVVREGEQLRMIIEDDGRGFDPAVRSTGMGRRNIETRVAALGGRLHYDSTPGHGTTVTIIIDSIAASHVDSNRSRPQ